jgi:hypothetical protein
MYLAHPEMGQLYDLPGVMLDNAQYAGIGNWFNSLNDQAHPGGCNDLSKKIWSGVSICICCSRELYAGVKIAILT